jgi:ribosome modulation factor
MTEATSEKFRGWNRAMVGAYRKGQAAAEAGESLESCPYADHRKTGGQLTWSRAFIKAWEDGWRDVDSAEREIRK